ncbi:sensor histidine kinase [Desulfurobacterium sp.]
MVLESKLFRKIVFIILSIVAFWFLIFYFVAVPLMKKTVYNLEEQAAKTNLNNIYEIVKTDHLGIEAYKHYAISAHKKDIKHAVCLAISDIKHYYNLTSSGKMNEQQAKKLVLSSISNWRYGNDNYIFVLSTNGTVLAHPDKHFLNKNVMKLKDIYGEFFIQKIIKTAMTNPDGGFVKYWWKKLDSIRPVEKVTYAKMFSPWHWVIGSGVYIDDVENELKRRKKIAINELRKVLKDIKMGGNGYIFIFRGDGTMIVHPNPTLEGKDVNNVINRLNGKNLTEELKKAAKTGKCVRYLWDKPSDPGHYVYKKIAWVKYFKPLDWYIVSSIYENDLMQGAVILTDRITVVFFIAAGVSFLIAYITFRKIIRPVNKLSELALQVKNGNLNARSDIKRDDELGVLSDVFNDMIQQLSDHIENLDKKVAERTEELHKKNQELENTLKKLKETQKQLIESEKMAALGSLVAGVAHEVNTPIGIGVTAASHLNLKAKEFMKKYKEGTLKRSDFEKFMETLEQSTEIILSNLERAAELIRSFKKIAVDQSIDEKRKINLKNYLKELLLSLRPKWKKTKHQVVLECPDNIEIETYPGAISQIITNLISNSLIHAFDSKKEGIMKIQVGKKDGKIILRYSDNGKGIPEDIQEKIFDPFFTTKRGQGGTGLGLHILYNIVTRKLNGNIKCISKPGEGTTFVIEFPEEVGGVSK